MKSSERSYEMKIVLDDGTTYLFYDTLDRLEEKMQGFKPHLSKAIFKKMKV